MLKFFQKFLRPLFIFLILLLAIPSSHREDFKGWKQDGRRRNLFATELREVIASDWAGLARRVKRTPESEHFTETFKDEEGSG